VPLSGTGVSARATVSITPNPLTITLPTGAMTGTGTVTLTNTAPAGGSSVAITAVSVAGGSLTTYFFGLRPGFNTCTGAGVAPGASCTVGVRYTIAGAPRGADDPGTITFTDTGTGSPQSGALTGHANP
jgi:hypothetical protein